MAALAIWCAPFIEDTKVGEVQGGRKTGDKEEGGGIEFVKGVYEELKEACEMIRENGSKRSQGVLVCLFFFFSFLFFSGVVMRLHIDSCCSRFCLIWCPIDTLKYLGKHLRLRGCW